MLEHEEELEEIRRMLHVNAELLERNRKQMIAEKEAAVKEAVARATQTFQKEMRMLVVNHGEAVDRLCQKLQEDLQEQRLSFEIERLNDREEVAQEKLTLIKEQQILAEERRLEHDDVLER